MPALSEILLVVLGAALTAALGVIGFLLKRRFSSDPVDAFLDRYERLRNIPADQPSSSDSGVMEASELLKKHFDKEFEQPAGEPELRTQADMNQFARTEYAREDEALERLMREALARMGPERREALEESQKAWTRYRDLFAGVIADAVKGGSMWPLMYDVESSEITRTRQAEIKSLLEEDEGFLGT